MSIENSINRLTQVIKAAGGGMSSPAGPMSPGGGNKWVSDCVRVKAQMTSNPNIRIWGCREQTGGSGPGCQCTTYERTARGGTVSTTGPVAVPCSWSECITQPVMFE